MRIADKEFTMLASGYRSRLAKKPFSPAGALCVPLLMLSGLFLLSGSYASNLDAVVAGLQQRYASVKTITGAFRQTYRAPGIDQVESGVFKMKRPGLMRWEYQQPEEKLFITDGHEAFLYSPMDRQVTIQPFSASDMRDTPLEFLLGGADIQKSFSVSWESDIKREAEHTVMIRLTPRKSGQGYEFVVLEIDPKAFDIRRIVIREQGGNTSEFQLTNVVLNARIREKEFRFNPPKGVEVIRLNNEE
jgi:outer membrane lipoprotein carrier protein